MLLVWTGVVRGGILMEFSEEDDVMETSEVVEISTRDTSTPLEYISPMDIQYIRYLMLIKILSPVYLLRLLL